MKQLPTCAANQARRSDVELRRSGQASPRSIRASDMSNSSKCLTWKPGAVLLAGVLFSGSLGIVMAVLVAGRSGQDSFARFIGYSLAFAIPTAVLVGGISVSVGLLLRRILPHASRRQHVVASVVAAASIFLMSAGFSWVVLPTIELNDFVAIPVAGSALGSALFVCWSIGRHGRSQSQPPSTWVGHTGKTT